jgi:hypothetical protein
MLSVLAALFAFVQAPAPSSDLARLQAMIEQIRPDRFSNAPAGVYEERREAALRNLLAYRRSLAAHEADPERVDAAIEAATSLDALTLDLRALAYGLARYQSPTMGDVVEAAAARLDPQRAALRRAALDRAAARETEYRVAFQEAQRCREKGGKAR